MSGATDPATKEVINATWLRYEGFREPSSPRFKGFEDWYDFQHDESLTSKEDILLKLRALDRKNSKPGDCRQWQSIFLRNVFEGDHVVVDGLRCELARICGGDPLDGPLGSMEFVSRRWMG